jgi:hypothetical protein
MMSNSRLFGKVSISAVVSGSAYSAAQGKVKSYMISRCTRSYERVGPNSELSEVELPVRSVNNVASGVVV